jgi:pseudouridine-5'-monophosphatase
VFEDAMNGVEAAHAAGMPCVWVPHAEQDKTLLEGKTELIIDSLEEFKPEMFGLPPYDT